MSARLTPWFSVDVTPARVGVYLTRGLGLKHDGVLRHWNGQHWSFMDNFSEPNTSLLRPREWRGLANPPKESQ